MGSLILVLEATLKAPVGWPSRPAHERSRRSQTSRRQQAATATIFRPERASPQGIRWAHETGRGLEKDGWRCQVLAGASRLRSWPGTDLTTSFADIAEASRTGLSAVNDLGWLRAAFVRAGPEAGRRCLPPRPAAAGRRCSAAGERDRCAVAQLASLPCPVRAGQDRDEERQKSCTTIQGRGTGESKTELSTGAAQYSSNSAWACPLDPIGGGAWSARSARSDAVGSGGPRRSGRTQSPECAPAHGPLGCAGLPSSRLYYCPRRRRPRGRPLAHPGTGAPCSRGSRRSLPRSDPRTPLGSRPGERLALRYSLRRRPRRLPPL